MGEKEVERILNELSDFRKEVSQSIRSIFEKLDCQNERIISCEKDFQYLEEKFSDNRDKLEKDIAEFFLMFRHFKERGVKEQIQESTFQIKVWFLIGALTFSASTIGVLVYEFIIKRI